jgi:hypothetical protein
MNQCLRCNKVSQANAIFCDECQSLLRREIQVGEHAPALSSIALSIEEEAVEAPLNTGPDSPGTADTSTADGLRRGGTGPV